MAQQEEIVLWIDRRWRVAIEKQLKGETLQEHLDNVLDELCNQLPDQEYTRISNEIQKEARIAREAVEAARTYSAYRVMENGEERYFKVSPGEELLATAQKLRHYLKDSNNAAGKFIGLFRNREPILPEEFQQMTVQRMENTGKVAGTFDIDFDKREFSAVNAFSRNSGRSPAQRVRPEKEEQRNERALDQSRSEGDVGEGHSPFQRDDSGHSPKRSRNRADCGATKEEEIRMIWITGDCHGNFERFKPEYFPEQAEMTKEDIVIICGDFGGVWFGDSRDDEALDWMERLPFTLAFVDGNHENYDAIESYPVEEWHGGKIQRIRPHVLHLMRGQIFELEGYRFFTMGGARSHDIEDGILELNDPDFERKLLMLRRKPGAQFRINHISWWQQELPSDEEYAEARRNLDRCDWQADYIITHCVPTSTAMMESRHNEADGLTDFLQEVKKKAEYSYWLFGHYHDNRAIDSKHILLWEQIVQII